jgi:hypothetical protein
VFVFDEHIRTGVLDLAGEALALAVVIAGAWILSHSCLILGEDEQSPVRCLPAGYQAQPSGRRRELDDYQPLEAPAVHAAEALPASPSHSALGQDTDISARQPAGGPPAP